MNYIQNGGTAALQGATFSSTLADQSSILIDDAAVLSLTNISVTKSGDTSSVALSEASGQNAAVLVASASTLNLISGVVISSSGLGAAGLFADGAGSKINGTGIVTVTTSGDDSAGLAAADGATATLAQANIRTTGAGAAGLFAAAGSTVTLNGGNVVTTGAGSNALTDNGLIVLSSVSAQSKGNIANLSATAQLDVTAGALTGQTGIVVQGASGGTPTADTGAKISLVRDLFQVTSGPGILADHAGADITLSAQYYVGSDALVDATNGSDVNVSVEAGNSNGDMIADSSSTLNVTLTDVARLVGAVTNASMLIGHGSVWQVTGASSVNSLLAFDDSATGGPASGSSAVLLNNDSLYVGNDNVTLFTTNGSSNSITVGGGDYTVVSQGRDSMTLDGTAVVFATGVDTIAAGSSGARLTLVTGAAAERLSGFAGSTTVFAGTGGGNFTGGAAGGNILVASSGNTTLTGAAAGDALFGGTAGQEKLQGGTSGVSLVGSSGAVTLAGGSASDFFFGGSGAAVITGSAGGGDLIVLGTGTAAVTATANDAVFASSGAASVTGGTNAVIFAGSGSMNATLAGGSAGETYVQSGSGTANITNGLARDVFDVTKGSAGGTDVIANFANGTDLLQFQGYGSGGYTETVSGNNTVFTLSDNTTVTLLGITDLSPSSFTG